MMDCPIQTRMKRVGMHQSISPLQIKPLKIRTMSQKPKWKQSQSNGISAFFFFFFLIGNKDYIKKHYLMQKNIRQREKYKGKERVQRLRKWKILSKKERAKEHRERITRGESPRPRPVKQSATNGGQKLVIRTIHVLKRPPISIGTGCPCFWIIWGLISTNILSDEWYFSNCYSPSLLIDQFLGRKRSEATSETRQIGVVVQSTIPTDNPTFQITTVKLDGHNHLAQSPS